MKKIISMILAVMLSAVLIAPAYAAEPVGNALLSKVVVSSVSQSTANPKETIKVSVALKNLNPTPLREIMVSVNGLSSNTLTLTNTFGPFLVDLEASGTSTVSFDLYASPDITGGNYPLSLTLTYIGADGFSASVARSISVLVDAPSANIATPNIIVSSYNIGAERVSIGAKFEMTFTLQNTSSEAALKNIMLNLSSEANAYTPVSGVSNQLYIGDIAAGGSYTGKVQLKANSALPSGIYTLNLGFQYQDVYNNTYNSSAGISIQLVGKATEEDIASPQVVVTSYDIGADQVFGGDAFEMTFILKNTSTDAAANVLLGYGADANAFISAPGMPNQLYIGNIAAGDSYTGKISLKANDALISGTYNLNIGLQYQDITGNTHTSATNISIQLEQKQKLSISSIKTPDTTFVNTKTLLNVSYENPGDNDIKNLVLNISGNIPENEKTVAIGTVRAGGAGNVDQFITPKSTGAQEIALSFTFEDSAGNTYTTPARTLTLNVQANNNATVTDNASPAGTTDNNMQGGSQQPVNLNSYWIYFVIAGVVLVAAAAGIVWRILYVKKKKKPEWSNSGK